MHMVSKKDLDKAELATVRTSKKSNDGSYSQQAKEEGTVHVRELYFFVTVMLLEIHRQFFSLGKLCEE